ncbi:MAG: glycosyltransferase [Betaproteobacteria bacterium]|nr:glycosyltransferase [Betaproteobacteria bacterium]
MKVLFLQEQAEVLEKLIHPRDPNPGVGGTSYLTCQVAYELHCQSQQGKNKLQVHLGCTHGTQSHFHGIPVINITDTTTSETWDAVITTGGNLDLIASGAIRLNRRRLIAWVHHPFDRNKIKKARHHHIDNLFCAERIRTAAGWPKGQCFPDKKATPTTSVKLGYMGGLIPSKGFHLLAKQWEAIKTSLAQQGIAARLDVIGGSNLYQFDQGHPQLPCDKNYGDFLQSILGKEINHSVYFHGTIGASRYALMNECHLAFVNPNGDGEAFPATILEWLCLGVPVLTSANFGCADAMRMLPSLTIQRPEQIPEKARGFLRKSQMEQDIFRDYCAEIGSDFSSKQSHIISQWNLLLSKPEQRLCINEYLPMSALRLLAKNFIAIQINRAKRIIRNTIT